MNPLRILFGLFACIGLICLILWFPATFRAIDKNTTWEHQIGTVDSITSAGYPVIRFLYNGDQQSFEPLLKGENLTLGKEVIVQFPEGDPQKAEIKSFVDDWLMSILLSVFVLIFGGIGAVGFSTLFQRKKLKIELFDMGRGKCLTLPIQEVAIDYSTRVNGNYPWIIRAQHHDRTLNILHTFKSDPIWHNPERFMTKRRDVDVYVDPTDYNRYYMDITFLPNER